MKKMKLGGSVPGGPVKGTVAVRSQMQQVLEESLRQQICFEGGDPSVTNPVLNFESLSAPAELKDHKLNDLFSERIEPDSIDLMFKKSTLIEKGLLKSKDPFTLFDTLATEQAKPPGYNGYPPRKLRNQTDKDGKQLYMMFHLSLFLDPSGKFKKLYPTQYYEKFDSYFTLLFDKIKNWKNNPGLLGTAQTFNLAEIIVRIGVIVDGVDRLVILFDLMTEHFPFSDQTGRTFVQATFRNHLDLLFENVKAAHDVVLEGFVGEEQNDRKVNFVTLQEKNLEKYNKRCSTLPYVKSDTKWNVDPRLNDFKHEDVTLADFSTKHKGFCQKIRK